MTEIFYTDVSGLDEKGYKLIIEELSPPRRIKAERLLKAEDKYLSAAAGYLLESVLTSRGVAVEEIIKNQFGKPYIGGNCLFFNLSHCEKRAAVAVSDGEIGIDIERIKPISDSVLKRISTSKEYDYLQSLNVEERTKEIVALWTAKESVLKYFGVGISKPMNAIECNLIENTVKAYGKTLPIRRYYIDDYIMTVCGDGFELVKEPVFFPIIK